MVKRITSDFLDSNIFIVEKNNCCVIIDAGVELQKFENDLNGKKVVGVFLTHGHYDHSFYALDYAKKFDCKIYGSSFLPEYLKNPDYNYSEGHFKVEDFSSFEYLKESGEMELGGIKIYYQQLGGHSKSDMVYEIEGDIFVGDILLGRDMGRIDLYGGGKAQMKTSLEYLLQKDYRIMHSGHGADYDKQTQDKVANLWLKFLNR